MKTLILGSIAAAIGLILLIVWWKPFMMLLAGVIPIMLLLGGGLAIYLGFDELKETWKKDDPKGGTESEADRIKRENEELKKELEALKAKTS